MLDLLLFVFIAGPVIFPFFVVIVLVLIFSKVGDEAAAYDRQCRMNDAEARNNLRRIADEVTRNRRD